MLHNTKNDAALRSPEEHDAIREARDARAAVDAACTRSPMEYGDPAELLARPSAEYPSITDAAIRDAERWANVAAIVEAARAENDAVSLDALSAKYGKVRKLLNAARIVSAGLRDDAAMALREGMPNWSENLTARADELSRATEGMTPC